MSLNSVGEGMRRWLAALILLLGIAPAGMTLDIEVVVRHITDDLSKPSSESVTDAFTALTNAGDEVPTSQRVDLLALILGKAQDQLHDQHFVDRLVLKLFESKTFTSLSARQQYNIVLAMLGNERLVNRKEHAAEPIYASELLVCLLKWLHGMDAIIDIHFDPELRPRLHPEPPPGYDVDISPEDISDLNQRKSYEARIAATNAAINHYTEQVTIRRERRICLEAIVEHLPTMALTKDAAKALRQRCLNAGIPKELLAEVFDRKEESP